MLKIGAILAAKLEEKDLSQKEAAAQLNINPKTFSTYVNDTYFPPLDVLSDICRLLDIDIDHLLGLEKNNNMDLLIHGKDEAKIIYFFRSLNKSDAKLFMKNFNYIVDLINTKNHNK